MITIEIADNYFSAHLDSAYWAGLSENEKTGALAMAEVDITPRMAASADAENTNFIGAVCEQAVYLKRNHAVLSGMDHKKSESISGAGSATYRQTSQSMRIAPRARDFIRIENGTTGLRFGRG